ncbi:MAG: hypothetical protein ACRD0P_30165 [Stackebrandtia sp.]
MDDPAEQFAEASAEYDSAEDRLTVLRDDRDDTRTALSRARELIDTDPRVTDATQVVENAATPIDRLGELADYHNDQALEMAQALNLADTATQHLAELDEQIRDQKTLSPNSPTPSRHSTNRRRPTRVPMSPPRPAASTSAPATALKPSPTPRPSWVIPTGSVRPDPTPSTAPV